MTTEPYASPECLPTRASAETVGTDRENDHGTCCNAGRSPAQAALGTALPDVVGLIEAAGECGACGRPLGDTGVSISVWMSPELDLVAVIPGLTRSRCPASERVAVLALPPARHSRRGRTPA